MMSTRVHLDYQPGSVVCEIQRYKPIEELLTTRDEAQVTCDDCLDIIEEDDRLTSEDLRYEPTFGDA